MPISAFGPEPKDLAWLLASYARDGLARVEAAGDAPALATVRAALEYALGVRFEGARGARFFHTPLVRTLFYGVFSAWVLWPPRIGTSTPRSWPVILHSPPPARAMTPTIAGSRVDSLACTSGPSLAFKSS
ncbi:MAG: hypothetical protein OXH76_09395 [Boseongicola sp.]|nr:hypothetical protein [Boseongicola sp.]